MCRYIKLLRFVIICAGFCEPLFLGVAQGSRWSTTGNLNSGRSGANAALLTDGRFLMMGGQHSSSSAEVFDPGTGIWTSISCPASGNHHWGILLYNGKVILGAAPVWTYDPINDNWDNLGRASMSIVSQGCATLLKDGNSIYLPNSQKCAIYDYNSIRPVAQAIEKHHAAVEILLPSGKVLLAGGSPTIGASGKKCEIYDPSLDTWTYTAPMQVKRWQATGVLLPPPWEKKILMAGGKDAGTNCELYDINSNTWSYTGNLNFSERITATMALLPSGKVLLVGGDQTKHKCEIYDPDSTTWSVADETQYPRHHFSLVILPTGKVLAAGSSASSVTQCEIYDASDGKRKEKLPLIEKRGAHTVTPLPIIPTTNCSTNVLIAGGENSSGALESCELYNYADERIQLTGALNVARTHHTAVLLASGKVLAAGGKNTNALKSSELYDVSGERWSLAGNMVEARFDHTATLLKDGKVLVTGGEGGSNILNSCEIYDIGAGSWSNAGIMSTPRTKHTAVLLLDGRVMVIGGETATGATNSCEMWNGAGWTGVASLSNPRCSHTATLLQSGEVLVVGGKNGTLLSNCEIYNPGSNNWSSTNSLNEARYLHNTTLLYSGLVFVSGGEGSSGYLSSCEIWDPAIREWKTDTTAPLTSARAYHSSVLIPAIKPYILSIGGKSSAGYLNSITQYDVGLGYREAWQPTITNYPAVTHISDSMHIQGTLFRGVSEADGGNHCHVVSNDHPIISLVRIGGGNWQGNGGGEILHMPLSSSWNETHTDVHLKIAEFKGYYRLWSIVNGIPCKWYKECVGAEESPQSTVRSPQLKVYPNPARGKISIQYAVGSMQKKDLSTVYSLLPTVCIYDLSGRLVRTLSITQLPNNPIAKVVWDGKDSKGRKVKSGIYFYRARHGDFEDRGKLVILK